MKIVLNRIWKNRKIITSVFLNALTISIGPTFIVLEQPFYIQYNKLSKSYYLESEISKNDNSHKTIYQTIKAWNSFVDNSTNSIEQFQADKINYLYTYTLITNQINEYKNTNTWNDLDKRTQKDYLNKQNIANIKYSLQYIKASNTLTILGSFAISLFILSFSYNSYYLIRLLVIKYKQKIKDEETKKALKKKDDKLKKSFKDKEVKKSKKKNSKAKNTKSKKT